MFCCEMDKSADVEMTGVCGLYCKLCEHAMAEDEEKFLTKTDCKQKFLCAGCRKVKGESPAKSATCDIYKCALQRNLTFCFECEEFPCFMLSPVSDNSDSFMHNLKIFNLCYIQSHGIDKFANDAEIIKTRYCKLNSVDQNE